MGKKASGDARQCAFTNPETSKRCGGYAMTGDAFCFAHSTAVETARAAARAKGGRVGSQKVLPPETADVPLDNVNDVKRLLGETINQVRRGELDVKTSNAVGYLAGIMLKCIETGDFEQQLTEAIALIQRITKERE